MPEAPTGMNPGDFVNEICGDDKLFRFGVDKRPALPHEREEYGFAIIFTQRGIAKAERMFAEMFPDCDFEKDSGIIWS